MRSRELRIVTTEEPVGTVGLDDDDEPFYDDGAEDVFAAMRERMGDEATVAGLLDDGWSNGYLYLAPEGAKR